MSLLFSKSLFHMHLTDPYPVPMHSWVAGVLRGIALLAGTSSNGISPFWHSVNCDSVYSFFKCLISSTETIKPIICHIYEDDRNIVGIFTAFISFLDRISNCNTSLHWWENFIFICSLRILCFLLQIILGILWTKNSFSLISSQREHKLSPDPSSFSSWLKLFSHVTWVLHPRSWTASPISIFLILRTRRDHIAITWSALLCLPCLRLWRNFLCRIF